MLFIQLVKKKKNTALMLQILLQTIQKPNSYAITEWNVHWKDDLKYIYNSLSYYHYQFANMSTTNGF